MGGGDIKLMALMGLIMGGRLVLLCLFLSALAGSLAGGLLLLTGGLKKEEAYLPYGPFISAGGLAALIFRRRLFILVLVFACLREKNEIDFT